MVSCNEGYLRSTKKLRNILVLDDSLRGYLRILDTIEFGSLNSTAPTDYEVLWKAFQLICKNINSEESIKIVNIMNNMDNTGSIIGTVYVGSPIKKTYDLSICDMTYQTLVKMTLIEAGTIITKYADPDIFKAINDVVMTTVVDCPHSVLLEWHSIDPEECLDMYASNTWINYHYCNKKKKCEIALPQSFTPVPVTKENLSYEIRKYVKDVVDNPDEFVDREVKKINEVFNARKDERTLHLYRSAGETFKYTEGVLTKTFVELENNITKFVVRVSTDYYTDSSVDYVDDRWKQFPHMRKEVTLSLSRSDYTCKSMDEYDPDIITPELVKDKIDKLSERMTEDKG